MGSFIIIPFIVIDDKLSKASASIAVLVSQSEATNSQLSSSEIAHAETKKMLESERVIHRQVLDEAEAKARETEGTKRKLEARAREMEGVLEVVRSELNGLHEGTKELRKVEKDKHMVEMVEMEEMEETESARK